MKIIQPGHIYQLEHLDGTGAGILVFVNREDGTEHEGTQTQDVLRVLIDRTVHCDTCLPWDGNDKIIWHLRMALALHECRALERTAEKGAYAPEDVVTASDGHYMITFLNSRGSRREEREVPVKAEPVAGLTSCDFVGEAGCSDPTCPRCHPTRAVAPCPYKDGFCKIVQCSEHGPVKPSCALQEGNCKGADCPEHGFTKRT